MDGSGSVCHPVIHSPKTQNPLKRETNRTSISFRWELCLVQARFKAKSYLGLLQYVDFLILSYDAALWLARYPQVN
jgi:hypothetical protein